MKLEINKIYDQDCLEGMKLLNDRSIDLICTDLPYGVTQNKSDIVIPFEPLWEQYERIIKENGAIVLFGQGMFYIDLVDSNRKLSAGADLKRLQRWVNSRFAFAAVKRFEDYK